MYQLTEYGVIRLSDNANIPNAEGNRDWVEYQAWLAAGNTPEPIPEPSPADLVQALIAANNTAYEAATKALTADYPQLEKDTWPTQDKESTAWMVDPVNAKTPFLTRAAADRGIGQEDYIRRTIMKARQFVTMSSSLTGRRQGYEDQIKAGGNPVLDFTLSPEVLAELQQISDVVWGTPATELKAALEAIA